MGSEHNDKKQPILLITRNTLHNMTSNDAHYRPRRFGDRLGETRVVALERGSTRSKEDCLILRADSVDDRRNWIFETQRSL